MTTNHEHLRDVAKVVLTAPERIFLQVSDQEWDSDKPFPVDCDGVSWWKEPVLDVEVQYVRADLFSAAEDGLARLRGVMKRALAELENYRSDCESYEAPELVDELDATIDATRAAIGDSHE
ncbi:hypothetical protein [Dyella sp. SG609]|uniref:hypothetical protein n=1 Tax=Dyella sp. SG609 TaxID=2587018 RepID=UPI0014470044|nr:hypothetical protein [Dyella sp. SG609]NKJ21970.1 hypothetical protein [Dyella sp. SG609]